MRKMQAISLLLIVAALPRDICAEQSSIAPAVQTDNKQYSKE
jgi:hypothetical protein